MEKMTLVFKSRTVWTGIVLWAVNFLPIVGQIVPEQWKPLVSGVLTVLAFYFHTNPSQSYGKSQLQD